MDKTKAHITSTTLPLFASHAPRASHINIPRWTATLEQKLPATSTVSNAQVAGRSASIKLPISSPVLPFFLPLIMARRAMRSTKVQWPSVSDHDRASPGATQPSWPFEAVIAASPGLGSPCLWLVGSRPLKPYVV